MMHIVTDNNATTLKLAELELTITTAPVDSPPFDVSARVEEQDVALLLGEDERIHRDTDKSAWYLANKLESQRVHLPGDVLVRNTRPMRLLALVHDFDQEPSWTPEWVARALANIANLIEQERITSICLSVLGARHGRIQADDFIQLFVQALLKRPVPCLQRIWLVAQGEDCEKILSILKACLSKQGVEYRTGADKDSVRE